MKHILILLSTTGLLLAGMTSQASATCTFLCEGSLIDSACNPLLAAPPSDTALWSDSTRAPLVAVACQVQCCAPGMCSDPEPTTIMASDLTLLNVKGMDLAGSFQEQRAPLCEGQQVFSIESTLDVGQIYDVTHYGLILSRFEYSPVAVVPVDDMGSSPDMDADMPRDMDPDTGADLGQDNDSDQGSAGEQDQGGDGADLGGTVDQDMGGSPSSDMGTTSGADMSGSSLADLGDAIAPEEETSGCQVASHSTPWPHAPLGLLGLGLLVGVRRLRRRK